MEDLRKTTILEFLYDNEEEKIEHKKNLELIGYEDSGQIKINISQSLSKPEYRLYGKYCKCE